MGKYFGTDGFRGEANVKLTVDHAFKVGRYVGWYYGRDHKAKIVIGKDTRRSSYMFEYALVAGLTASGADVYLLHVTTTPSVSYAVRTEDFDCGIMISASHNPFYDNGIKLLNGNGQKIEAEVEARIEAYLDGLIEDLPLATKEDIGRTVDFASGRNRYIGHLISIPCHDFKNIKVGLDCSNGSSSAIAKSVFDALRAKTYVINNEPNGTNINRGCGSTHIEVLRQFVVDKGLDIGFAYDGDADRCLAVDEQGNLVDGDKIIATVTLGWDAEAGKVVTKNLDGWQFGEVVEYTAPEGSKNIWWGYKWYNLPAYDAGGNIYRYYAKEKTPVGSGWQLVTDDTNATNNAPIPANSENRVFQITNTPITYTLPETGGIGTLPYTAGGLLLMAAAALLLGQEIKRRREGC